MLLYSAWIALYVTQPVYFEIRYHNSLKNDETTTVINYCQIPLWQCHINVSGIIFSVDCPYYQVTMKSSQISSVLAQCLHSPNFLLPPQPQWQRSARPNSFAALPASASPPASCATTTTTARITPTKLPARNPPVAR